MTRCAVVLFAVSALLSSPVAGQTLHNASGAETEAYVLDLTQVGPERLIVEFDRGVTAASMGNVFERFRRDIEAMRSATTNESDGAKRRATVEIEHEYSTVFYGAAVTAHGGSAARLRGLPYVRAVHEDLPVKAFGGSGAAMARRAVGATALAERGKGITIAIIDTGIDYTHPALGGGFGAEFKVIGGWDFVNDDADPIDDHGHGTHVAGIAAANGAELAGVAPDAKLLAYKVLNFIGTGETSDVIAAIERAVDPNNDGDTSDRANVINLSLGTDGGTADSPSARAVDAAVAAGSVVVIAAGNSGRVASVGTPGASRMAITVGALETDDKVTFFSSRGPTPGLLTFKPDVMAPGYSVVSAKRGGGTVALSGTSMAAPHVAGVAALLLETRPEWTPADVKSALIVGARPVQGDGFLRGAGRVDADAAAASTLSVSASGWSLGILADSEGTWERSGVVTVANRGAAVETFAVSVGETPSGMSVTVTPSELTLAPGQSTEVTVRASADSKSVSSPASMTLGGTITFAGSRTFTLPWAVLRASRVTVTSDRPIISAFAYEPFGRTNTMTPLSANAGELVTTAGDYDFLFTGSERDDSGRLSAVRLIIRSGQKIRGDQALAISHSEAAHSLDFAGVDSAGRPLKSLESRPRQLRISSVKLYYYAVGPGGQSRAERAYGFHVPSDVTFYLSSFASPYVVATSQLHVDADALRAYAMHFPPLRKLDASATLTADPNGYRNARLRWTPATRRAPIYHLCAMARSISITAPVGCLAVPHDGAAEIFINGETHHAEIAGFALAGDGINSGMFRARGDAIVASTDHVPPKTAIEIPKDGVATVGVGPLFAGSDQRSPFVVVGPYGDRRFASTHYTVRDENGTVLSSGTLLPWLAPTLYETLRTAAGVDFAVSDIAIAGRPLNATLSITRTGPVDREPPTLTSIRLVRDDGQVTDRLHKGGSAILHFSAGDWDRRTGITSASRPELTKVSYRSGSGDWVPLAPEVVGLELGSIMQLGHMAAGEIYRVDVTPALAAHDSEVSLRIELQDSSGNTAVWTQTPAFVVGNPAPIVKRRSAAK